MFLLSSVEFFQNIFKEHFQSVKQFGSRSGQTELSECQTVWIQIRTDRIIRLSNGLDPDQDRHVVGPDLDPNCLHRLSADDKSCC